MVAARRASCVRRHRQYQFCRLRLLPAFLGLQALLIAGHSLVFVCPAGSGGLRRPRVACQSQGEAEAKADLTARKPLAEFQIGQEVEGTVAAWFGNNGYLVEIGAKVTAQLEACELSDGLPKTSFNKKDRVKARILDVDDDGKKVFLTLRDGPLSRPPRKPYLKGVKPEDIARFSEAVGDTWFEGEVQQLAMYGAFVRCQQPDGSGEVDGMLHKSEIPLNAQKRIERGKPVKVRVRDTQGRKMFLSMREPAD